MPPSVSISVSLVLTVLLMAWRGESSRDVVNRSPLSIPDREPGLCRYFMQAVRLAMKDDQVRTGLAVVNHMLDSPAALFQPRIAFKVFSLALQDALAQLRDKVQGRQVQRA